LTGEGLSEVEEVEIMVEGDENAMMVSIVLMRNGEKTCLNLPVTVLTGQPP
jgi:hypothetical protein